MLRTTNISPCACLLKADNKLNMDIQNSRRIRWIRSIFSPTVGAMIILLLVAGWLSHWLSRHDLREFRESQGNSVALVSVPIHIVLALTPFPVDVVAIANGAMFGFGYGAVLNWLGWWIAAVSQFALGRRATKDFNLEGAAAKLPLWLNRLSVDHPIYLILARQIPWLGMHVGSFVPGLAGIRFGRFLWCSMIGAIPGSVLMAAVGAGLMRWAYGS